MENGIGVINVLRDGGRCFGKVAGFGLRYCQLVSWNCDLALPEIADAAREDAARAGVTVTAFWAGVPGPAEWNFERGPATLGLVPPAYREMRLAALRRWADFAVRLGAPAIITHFGFLPENMDDPLFEGTLAALADIAAYCRERGLGFWLETGQETPVTMKRFIVESGADNLGVNLDPANLILYGKGNPIDALDVLGPYVRNIHAKDGLYPTDPRRLGREVPVGEGRVRYPLFVRRLAETGFTGEFIIEREISGDEQDRDIRAAIGRLRSWMAGVDPSAAPSA